ncbi:MAG TPA: histidine phosphatase family protein [Roseiflexaceae bacterium]|nr:histidine phosphatase family protein [Roseiflexaceae bacterium]
MRTSIWLVRHGQTQLNKERRYQGAGDSPLTLYGRLQTEALARRLRRIPFHVALVSPVERARLTAEAILAGRHIPVVEDARWAEVHHGRWEGLTFAEVAARFPDEVEARFGDLLNGRVEGGESLAEVYERVAAAWDSLPRERPGGRILVVTHATPIQLALCAINSLPATLHWRWRVDLGSLTAVDIYAAGPIVRMVNEVPRALADHDALEEPEPFLT